MDNTKFRRVDRIFIRVGSWAVVLGWVMFGFWMISIAIMAAFDLFGNSRITASHFSCKLMFVFFGLFLLFGLSYLLLFFRVKCPSCGFMILRNPKGIGPSNFDAHPSCKKVRGFNAWSYQIVRAIRRHRIRCIKCGQDELA